MLLMNLHSPLSGTKAYLVTAVFDRVDPLLETVRPMMPSGPTAFIALCTMNTLTVAPTARHLAFLLFAVETWLDGTNVARSMWHELGIGRKFAEWFETAAIDDPKLLCRAHLSNSRIDAMLGRLVTLGVSEACDLELRIQSESNSQTASRQSIEMGVVAMRGHPTYSALSVSQKEKDEQTSPALSLEDDPRITPCLVVLPSAMCLADLVADLGLRPSPTQEVLTDRLISYFFGGLQNEQQGGASWPRSPPNSVDWAAPSMPVSPVPNLNFLPCSQRSTGGNLFKQLHMMLDRERSPSFDAGPLIQETSSIDEAKDYPSPLANSKSGRTVSHSSRFIQSLLRSSPSAFRQRTTAPTLPLTKVISTGGCQGLDIRPSGLPKRSRRHQRSPSRTNWISSPTLAEAIAATTLPATRQHRELAWNSYPNPGPVPRCLRR